MSPIRFAMMVAAMSGLIACVAEAHPRLLGTNPAANATVPAPRSIQLRFSERLIGQFSGADVVKLAPGGRPASKIDTTRAKLSADGRSFTIVPSSQLLSGTYQLAWHAVSTDTHRVQGIYLFRVR
jgi:methionine-rich copper-binding protein CopC